MGATYSRQSSFSDGDTINSSLFNNEYDQLVAAFASATGHTHDGTTGEGGVITKVGPAQELTVSGSSVLPKTSNAIDLGSSTYKFKDAYFAGDVTADGSITYNGNVVLGSDATDTLTINATIQGSSLVFEGATADAYELTLAIPDATADVTVTLPNATDTLVGKATTDTLTNKTLTSPTLNTPTITGHTTFSDGAYNFDVASHDGTNGLKLGGTLVTATATELNLMDGVTSTTAELNILDGVTSTAAELNILDGVTSTAAELNILDGVTSTATELNLLDGVTSTTAELNILDGVTATYTELNILDGVTSTAAELNILDGVTSTATEINLLDGITAIKDEDDMSSDSATSLATQQSIKAYVDAQVDTADTLEEMSDTVITTPADSHFLVHNGTNWINETGATARASLGVDSAGTINYTHPNHSGDVTSTADGATVISAGAVDIAMLSATGTAGATTFLRGDNTWVVPTDTDTNTNQLTTFTVSATTDTTPTTISQGDDLMFTAGTGITCETTADGTVTISNTVTDTDTVYTHPTTAGNEHLPSSVSQTEAGYLDGVTSGIQTQLGAKLPLAGGTITGDLAIDGDTTLAAYNNTAAITGNAVDVFIYDTSNDSDGGAWRKRTQATSWYNETLNTSTRGSRKEFPSVAVIVAESNKVTIYDGDTPDLDMWMVFNTGTNYLVGNASSAFSTLIAKNGKFIVGRSTNGMYAVDFIAENNWFLNSTGGYYSLLSSVQNRNSSGGFSQLGTSYQQIVSDDVNDIAMTVLPNAPIDSTTGLPIPTIAVATDGGVSVIKDDGTVVDITGTDGNTRCTAIWFDDNNEVWFKTSQHVSIGGNTIPSSDYSNYAIYDFFRKRYFYTTAGGIPPVPAAIQNNSSNFGIAKDTHIVGYNLGLNLLKQVDEAPETSSVAYLTSTYNSGYMTGDIKGAWLSDTDTTNVVGTNLMSGASFVNTDRLSSHSYTNGSDTVVMDDDEASGDGYISIALNGLTASTTYVISWVSDFTYPNSSVYRSHIGSSASGTVYEDTAMVGTLNGNITFTTATSGSPTLVLYSGYSGGNLTYTLDLRLADQDRSVNANGLQVNGTITKTAVATGADLVAYSGFSASNYLEQPYNSDLDFGTGDFSVMGWTTLSVLGGTKAIIGVGDLSGSNGGWLLGYQATGIFRVWEAATTSHSINLISSTSIAPLNVWTHVCFSRTNGVMKISVNGVSESVVSDARTMTHTNAVLNIGISDNGAYPNDVGSLALWRISATAPTAAQILEIYNAERPMFTENANVTLHGTSDAVTALSFDDSNEELVVATSGGLSVFKGLIRVDEEDGNFTEVSQQGGMRIVEKA